MRSLPNDRYQATRIGDENEYESNSTTSYSQRGRKGRRKHSTDDAIRPRSQIQCKDSNNASSTNFQYKKREENWSKSAVEERNRTSVPQIQECWTAVGYHSDDSRDDDLRDDLMGNRYAVDEAAVLAKTNLGPKDDKYNVERRQVSSFVVDDSDTERAAWQSESESEDEDDWDLAYFVDESILSDVGVHDVDEDSQCLDKQAWNPKDAQVLTDDDRFEAALKAVKDGQDREKKVGGTRIKKKTARKPKSKKQNKNPELPFPSSDSFDSADEHRDRYQEAASAPKLEKLKENDRDKKKRKKRKGKQGWGIKSLFGR